MNLRFLRTFVAIADNAGFARAAARLNLTQSAASRQIRSLEDELGLRLFARITAGHRESAGRFSVGLSQTPRRRRGPSGGGWWLAPAGPPRARRHRHRPNACRRRSLLGAAALSDARSGRAAAGSPAEPSCRARRDGARRRTVAAFGLKLRVAWLVRGRLPSRAHSAAGAARKRRAADADRIGADRPRRCRGSVSGTDSPRGGPGGGGGASRRVDRTKSWSLIVDAAIPATNSVVALRRYRGQERRTTRPREEAERPMTIDQHNRLRPNTPGICGAAYRVSTRPRRPAGLVLARSCSNQCSRP